MRVALIVALVIVGGCRGGAHDSAAAGGREAAPAFDAATLEGESLRFRPESLARPVLLVFWASWCESCRRETPGLVDLHRRLAGRLDVVGVNVDRSPERALEFARESGIPYASVSDPDLAVADLFDVHGTPALILIDQDGTVVRRGNGLAGALREALEALE